jgi:peroxiredoxin family protein
VYIIRLKKRVTPNMKKFEKQKTNYFKQMLTRRQREFQEAWLKQLRKRAKIEKNMKAIMSKRF